MLVCVFVFVATIVAAAPAAADVMCYACNSYMAQCNFNKLATNTNNNVFQARCTSKCFTRQGEDDAIYRGCFDAFKAVKQLTDDYVGCRNQTWNNRVRRWCLCDTDLCNRFPIEQNYQRLPNSRSYRRHRTHHHPLPPPKPAPSKTYVKESGVEPVDLNGEEKDNGKTSYRTVWTNYQALPENRRRSQPTSGRSDDTEKKTADRSRTRDSRTRDQLGHVVSHSVYPDQWKANVAALVDRRHAKSSENVAGERQEPLIYRDEGQMSRSNYSASHGVHQPSTGESQDRSTSAADRQGSRDVAMKGLYDYTVHDFESDDENVTSELDQLEYPYNQEITHQAVWTPFDDYLAPADFDQPVSVAEQPQTAKTADADDQSVDYPYNQDHGARMLETYDLLDNGLWKEATADDEVDKQEEDLGLIVDYPYNQLFGQGASEFPVLTGYYENAADERRRENASTTAPVEHTVHTVEFPDFDVIDLASPPPRRHIYHSYPAAPASHDHHRQQKQQPRRNQAEDPALPASKTVDPLTAEFNLEKTRFVPVPAALVDKRHAPARQPDPAHEDVDDSSDRNVGRRRLELAKEGVDSLDYVESFADIQMAPDDKFVFLPTVPQIRCVHTGYYQNPKDCTQFVACLFDHNTRTKVLHLMRCPSGLVWDNVHKLCMESSSTCHAALAQHPSTPIDSYMQYFAKLAAAAAATPPDDSGNALTQPRVKEQTDNS